MRSEKIILCLILLLATTLAVAAPAADDAASLMEKGESCRYAHLYNKALTYYQQANEQSAVAADKQLQLEILERMMRTHDVLYHWKELSEASYQLYQLAEKFNDKPHMASARFMQGKRMHLEGHKEQGYQACLQAIQQMKETDYPEKNHELAAFYGILTRMYGNDGNYEQAMKMSQEQEVYVRQAIQDHSTKHDQHGYLRLYALRVWLLAKMGRMAEADSLYKQHVGSPVGDPICNNALPEYYKMRQMNEEALRFNQMIMKSIREDGDTVSRNMQRLLDDEGDIYYRMGDYQKAAECYIGVTTLADTLSVRSLRSISSEVQRAIVSEQAVSRHNLILSVIIAAVLLLLVVVVLLLRHDRIINRKNKAMTSIINELMHYREIVMNNGDSVEMGENENVEESVDDDERRFRQVDKRIMKEELFRDPDFGRDELMRLMGVDKNAISSIVFKYAGTNVTGYINTKRMEYAVSLMRQHPEYSLSAISEACGIKSPATFIRNFRNAYGMTPSEFRSNMEELPPPNGQSDNNF